MRQVSLTLLAGAAALALSLLLSSPCRASSASDIQSVMNQIEVIVTKLALDETLDAKETDNLRKQLAAIYRDLEQIRDQLPVSAGGSGGASPNPGNLPGGGTANSGVWQSYSDATLDMTPAQASFSGWQSGYNIQSGFSNEAGTLRVTIDNVKYRATWNIRNAYTGNVKTSTTAEKNGDVTIVVNDDEGQHRFLIRNGGTGPLFLSAGTAGGKQVSPVDGTPDKPTGPSKPSGAPIEGKWYQAYRDLVAARQLDYSEAMEWFIDQANRYDYVNDALRDLGQKCKSIEGLGAIEQIGVMSYYSAGQPKKLSIPDPRVSPASFVMVVNKAYILQNAGEWYKIEVSN